jgi:large subunit ribosomal protein L6
LTRSLISNMVEGVSEGFVRTLEIEGVGYQAELQGKNLNMKLGFSHPVVVEPPEGIEFEVPKEDRGRVIHIRGIDKQVVGQIAANIRELRPPEPYKGKGVRYRGERIIRKAGKAGKK